MSKTGKNGAIGPIFASMDVIIELKIEIMH